MVLTGLTPIPPGESVVRGALVVNLILVGGLVVLVGLEAGKLWVARRRGRAGARLHLRILALFSIVAVVPAIIVAIVASVTLDRGLDTWFSDRTRSIVETSLAVAEAYLREHGQVIRADLLAMANDLERAKRVPDADQEWLQRFFTAQAAIRALPAAFLLDENGNVLMQAETHVDRKFLMPPKDAIEKAKSGEAVVIAPGPTNQVGAIVQMPSFDNAFLYVARAVDPQVLNYQRLTQANAAEYSSLERRRFGVQIAFGLMYIGFALILLLSAMWVGIGVANRLVSPIRRLIGAADQVAQGNLYVQVPVKPEEGELASLGATFNKMTTQLRSQRDELLSTNQELDERRHFIETVLAGVPAGVIGLDGDGVLTLTNRSARELLGSEDRSLLGHEVDQVFPELAAALQNAREHPGRLVQDQVVLRRGNKERTITVRVASERHRGAQYGFVVTLDDITELVTAQRNSAWADVARRIAHEIKNPLTPIQLSAERLRRKYRKAITTDVEVFDQCTDTIIRQVGDIGRMVDEFSAFARMPKPAIEAANVVETAKQAVFLMRVGHPDIRIDFKQPDEQIVTRYDRRLISQAVTNIVKNAVEAISAVPPEELEEGGRISVGVDQAEGWVSIDVIDNGIGLPAQNRQRLLEPYMTTREKGTGLGLAIVARIMEEHGGRIELGDAPSVAEGGHGAWVRLTFPLAVDEAAADVGEPEARAAVES